MISTQEMDYRKINSHLILLAIVVVVGLLVSMIARLTILEKGADTGTANLVFLIVLGICAIFYFVVIAVSSSILDIIARKFFPWMTRKKRPDTEAETAPLADNAPVENVEQIKQDADRQFAERRKEKIELFLRYAHRTIGPYVTSDELARLDRCVECYGREEACPVDFAPIRPEKLKNADLFHFGWNMAHYFGQPKQDVVPWLKAVFVPLSDLEDSYIKGKLRDYQTEKYTIPNIEDIPKYMAEHNG